MKGKLTHRQALFVDEYMVDLSAKHAAIRAGYSVRSAESLGVQLLKNSKVAAAITEKHAVVAERSAITIDTIIQRLDGEATNPENEASARIRANELLGKHLGMFPRDVALLDQRQVNVYFNAPPLDTPDG